MNRILSVLCALTISVSASCVWGQTQGSNTLFEYPVAPDTCSTFESRCNYVVVNFWNNYDISRPISDEAAFESAFRDYIGIFKYAHRNIVISSVRDFIFKARANTSNLSKIGKIAESSLYGINAEFWSDELYLEIVKALSESSNLKADERKYYKHQYEVVSKCAEGSVFPDIEITTGSGKMKLSSIEGEFFLLLFTDSSLDSSIQRTRMSTDVGVEQLVSSDGAKLVQINLEKVDNDWFASQPSNWINGYNAQIASMIDLRMMPCCYVLDKDRKILNKNLTVDNVKDRLN